MNLFARATSDRRGHGVQAPQAVQGRGGVDAAERVGEIGFALATGSEPDRFERQRLGTAAHYAFSGLLGAVYALTPVSADVRAGRGLAFGTAVWVLADEGLIPALALSRGPRQLPAAVHAYAWLGHCVYASRWIRRCGG